MITHTMVSLIHMSVSMIQTFFSWLSDESIYRILNNEIFSTKSLTVGLIFFDN